MRKFTIGILLIGVTFLLFGSIGINVFSHSCEENGTFVSYFVEGEHFCESNHDEVKSCCASDQHQESKDDCCDDEIKSFKLKLDYFQSVTTTHFIAAEYNDVYAEADKAVSIPNLTIANYANPPPISRKRRSTQIQVWII
jgi:hypothetical protein